MHGEYQACMGVWGFRAVIRTGGQADAPTGRGSAVCAPPRERRPGGDRDASGAAPAVVSCAADSDPVEAGNGVELRGGQRPGLVDLNGAGFGVAVATGVADGTTVRINLAEARA